MASSDAASLLRELKNLRMQGRAPAHPVMVTNLRTYATLFEELGFLTVYLRMGEELRELDWAGVRGLGVHCVLGWDSQAERLQLYEAITAQDPDHVYWFLRENRKVELALKLRKGVPSGRV